MQKPEDILSCKDQFEQKERWAIFSDKNVWD